MGIWVVDSAGLPGLLTSYDANGDDRLTKAELLADVKLDDRPLGKVLTDERAVDRKRFSQRLGPLSKLARSEEHTSELQSLMRLSYAVFCLKKKNNQQTI